MNTHSTAFTYHKPEDVRNGIPVTPPQYAKPDPCSSLTPYPVPDQSLDTSAPKNASQQNNNSNNGDTKPASAGVVLQPETITVKGLVGEISSALPALSELEKYTQWVEPSVRSLDPVLAFVPEFAANARKYYNEAERIARVTDTVARQARSLWGLWGNWGKNDIFKDAAEGQLPATKQIEAFDFFRYLWANRTLVTVETSWKIYKNMAIETITQPSHRKLT